MNRREFVVSAVVGMIPLPHVSRVAGQAKPVTPDLAALADRKGLKLFNASRAVWPTSGERAFG
jgi:hypothetical protein